MRALHVRQDARRDIALRTIAGSRNPEILWNFLALRPCGLTASLECITLCP